MRSVVEGRTVAGMRAQLARTSRCVTIPAGTLFWAHPDVFLPYFFVDRASAVIERREAVARALGLWSDDLSRRRYVALVKARLSLQLGPEIDVDEPEPYFLSGRYTARPDEHYVDCGAYDGDAIRQYLAASGDRFGAITAFEPDEHNYTRLIESISSLSPDVRHRIEAVQAAVGARSETVSFSADLLEQSHISEEGDRLVQCIALDDGDGPPPTLVKLDVEGEEPNALLGMRRLISEHRPVLAVSVYHTLDHVWSLPLLIDSIAGSYRFHLACHGMASWDTICYAIPEERAVS
jgi:FkbM family methyltransferase